MSRFSYLLVLAVWVGALWLGLDFAARPKPVPTAVPTTEMDWAGVFRGEYPAESAGGR
jgi:hypothetical protein